MYRDEYSRWCKAELVDFDLKRELTEIAGDEDAIRERFAASLSFGTAGLRGTLGVGTNRMNIWVVRQATQGIADWVKTKGGSQTVAISYDSRLKGWNFARDAASVLAANGIQVRLYDELMPVPALSFATRYYNCNAGIMITASHNPARPEAAPCGPPLSKAPSTPYRASLRPRTTRPEASPERAATTCL